MNNSTPAKRITLATIKSFVRKNAGNLFIRVESRFNGMTDSVEERDNAGFTPTLPAEGSLENRMGIMGAWFVLRGGDSITAFAADGFTGFKVRNSCGSFVLAIKSV